MTDIGATNWAGFYQKLVVPKRFYFLFEIKQVGLPF